MALIGFDVLPDCQHPMLHEMFKQFCRLWLLLFVLLSM